MLEDKHVVVQRCDWLIEICVFWPIFKFVNFPTLRKFEPLEPSFFVWDQYIWDI